jgi:hypothetical protein
VRKDGWTAWEVEHIARHGVTPQEVEELLMPPYLVSRIDAGVRAVSGRTLGGRLLIAIVTDGLAGQGSSSPPAT